MKVTETGLHEWKSSPDKRVVMHEAQDPEEKSNGNPATSWEQLLQHFDTPLNKTKVGWFCVN